MAKNKLITEGEDLKEYIATQTIRIGSNEDGTPKFNFVKNKPIKLNSKQSKTYKNYIK